MVSSFSGASRLGSAFSIMLKAGPDILYALKACLGSRFLSSSSSGYSAGYQTGKSPLARGATVSRAAASRASLHQCCSPCSSLTSTAAIKQSQACETDSRPPCPRSNESRTWSLSRLSRRRLSASAPADCSSLKLY